MPEKIKGEKGLTPESLEDQKHKELQVAVDEENRIMEEIDKVLTNTPNREEAEKIILEKYAPLIDEAMKKSGETLKAWIDIISVSSERERKEIDDIEKDLENE